MAITINQNENQLISISNNNTQEIGINQNENQLINIENSTTQDINLRQNENQLILIDDGGNIVGITDVLVNGVSVVSGTIAYVIVPTKTSELTNDSGFLTHETDPTVPTYIKQISLADIASWNNKQNELVSGSTIKTINNESLLGSGNIVITGTQYEAGTGINISNDIISNTITSYEDLEDLPTIPTKTSDLLNDNNFVESSQLADVAFSGDYNDLNNLPSIPQNTSDLVNDGEDGTHPFISNYNPSIDLVLKSQISGGEATLDFGVPNSGGTAYVYNTLQNELVSGTNIKTINNTSLLGSGNINIAGGTSTDVLINDSSITVNNVANIKTNGIYNDTTNKIATMSDISTKQDTLVSGTNIKTINNNSLLGSGNLQLNGIGCWYAYGSITWSSAWSWEKIPIWGTIYDNANFILYSNGIYIPAGVSLIKITINCSLYNVDCGGDKNLAIYKNGVLNRSIAYVNYDTTNKYINITGQTILNVAQSDEISVQLNSELAGTMRIFDSTTFTIEILG